MYPWLLALPIRNDPHSTGLHKPNTFHDPNSLSSEPYHDRICREKGHRQPLKPASPQHAIPPTH
jgi:hypothetical protein